MIGGGRCEERRHGCSTRPASANRGPRGLVIFAGPAAASQLRALVRWSPARRAAVTVDILILAGLGSV